MVLSRAFRDGPVIAFMVAQTVIWAALFYTFPALVLAWEAEFGWSMTALMAAFSFAIAVQGLGARWVGRLIDSGFAPITFPLGACVGATGLMALSVVDTVLAFVAFWVLLGAAMSLTLYDACFALVTRARGQNARGPITAITLAAGFASSIAFPLTAWVSEVADWRVALRVLAAMVLFINLPLVSYASLRLEREAKVTRLQGGVTTPQSLQPFSLPGAKTLAFALCLAAFGTGALLSHLLPMMAAIGITGALAIFAASAIGPMQVAGRLGLMFSGLRLAALPAIQAAFFGMGLAMLLFAGASLWPWLILGFAVLQGISYGLTSILRPLVIRDVLGQRRFGEIQGALLQPALLIFAAAPAIAAVLAGLGGYGLVIALCLLAQFTGLMALRRLNVLDETAPDPKE